MTTGVFLPPPVLTLLLATGGGSGLETEAMGEKKGTEPHTQDAILVNELNTARTKPNEVQKSHTVHTHDRAVTLEL